MALSAKDKLDYKQGILEIFETLATTIQYTYFESTGKRNVYGRYEEEEYSEPITLTAQVKPEVSDSKNFNQQNEGVKIDLTVEIPLLELENHSLDPYSLENGRFILDERHYEILSVIPKGAFAQMFTSYEFQCKGVDVV